MTRLFRLILLVLILLFAFTLSAQDDDTCNLDLTNAIRDLKSAQADIENGSATSAMQIMEDVQTQIADILAACEYLTIDLPQTITSNDEAFGSSVTVHYPDGWVAEQVFASIDLANSQETLDLSQLDDVTLTLPEGAIYTNVTVVSRDIVAFIVPDGEDLTPLSIINAVFTSAIAEDFDLEDPIEETLNGRSAATIVLTGNAEEMTRAFVVIVAVDDGFVVLAAATNPNETDFDDTVRAIAGAVEATFTDSE